MKSVKIHTKKPEKNTPVPPQQSTGDPVGEIHGLLISPCENLDIQIAKRAYELHGERGYHHGWTLDDWLEVERQTLSQIPPA